jgi:uncharacterized protein (DUF924 family)
VTGLATPDDVLEFWLGKPGDPPLAKEKTWWKKDEAFDQQIRDRFQATLERAVAGELASWRETPKGRLALVILFDQFSRNMFRGTPRAFAQDSLAQDVAAQALDAGDDDTLPPVAASFLYMPFMHAENVAGQDRCVAGYEKMLASCPADVKAMAEHSLKYAHLHRDIVVRFGRFPHRNAILERPSTPEEAHFLTQPNSSF